jgi:hypothetical protein
LGRMVGVFVSGLRWDWEPRGLDDLQGAFFAVQTKTVWQVDPMPAAATENKQTTRPGYSEIALLLSHSYYLASYSRLFGWTPNVCLLFVRSARGDVFHWPSIASTPPRHKQYRRWSHQRPARYRRDWHDLCGAPPASRKAP